MPTPEAVEIRQQAAIKKARALRWKKPLVQELNLDEIRAQLSDMDQDCSNVRWYLGQQVDDLDELLGEDDAGEFKASFTALAWDIERILEQFNDIWVPDYFDDFLAAVHPEGHDLYGYDSYEDDYFRLDTYESEYACQQASDRIQRRTKKEIIDCAHVVIGIICQFVSVKYRFDSLSAAFDVLTERAEKTLQAAREIETLYEAAEREGFEEYREATRSFDRLLRELPDRYWLE